MRIHLDTDLGSDTDDACALVMLRACRTSNHGIMTGADLKAVGRVCLSALARFAPRSLVLDLADQVSTHLREGMIKVALVGISVLIGNRPLNLVGWGSTALDFAAAGRALLRMDNADFDLEPLV
jgi:hypothetical protein